MDTWNCEWVVNDSTRHDSLSTSNNKGTASCSTVDSPCTSKDDSNENCLPESSEQKISSSVTKPTFKSVLQAKKRLQAFSAIKQLKRSSGKDDKTEDVDKTSPKKSKKALYPLDKAQAVVQEIEEIKQKQVANTQGERTRIDCTMAVAYKTLSLKDGYHGRSRSSSSEREMQFRKREIKSRNYRRSDSFRRRSASPENRGKKAGKYVYPQNWTEYKQQGLTLVKDEELRSKLFPKQKHDVQQLVTKLLTLDGPCPLIESFKSFSVDEKLETIPTSFLRITRSKPTLLYSINSSRNKYSFVSRKQLFDVVSKERRSVIEKLINSASSKSQFQNRTLTSRLWYSKSWKKSADAECKILENSVGLSFLQTYSDEEEDNENEESVTTKDVEWESKASQKETPSNQVHEDTPYPTKESGTLTPEDKPEVFLKSRVEMNKIGKAEYQYKHDQNDKSKKEVGTPERAKVHDSEEKTKGKDEVNKTKKAIKELEQELERRKTSRMEDDDEEEEKEAKRAKKKRKKKRKESSSDTEEESEKSKKKRKKKVKTKKKKYVEADDESSSDNETSKRARKRNRRKKEKLKQKKDRSKKGDSSGKECKAKKKEEEADVKANEDQRKKRKSQEDAGEEAKKNKIKGKKNAEATGKIDIPNEDLGRLGRIELAAKKEERLNEDLKKFHDSSLFKDLECSLKSNSRSNFSETKTRESLSRHGKEVEKRRSIERDACLQKDSRRSRFDREISEETADEGNGKKDVHIGDERRSKERSKERYRWKEVDERKADRESWKSKRLDESRRSDENFDKADMRKERKSSKDKQEESSRRSLKSCHSKTEPDWEDLRIKRDKHRLGDYKEPLINFCDGLVYSSAYPAKEHDGVKLKEGHIRMEFGTPDTEEYRENWEDSYPIWESEDEAPAKRNVKLNSSWESDEEIFERSRIEVERESARPLNDIFDLEIPLNIKPFKRREPIDPDTELLMLKKQRLSISEERRMLEIEKLRVKELEMEVIMEVEGKGMKSDRRRSKDDEKREENLGKRKERLEKEALTPKRGRWDKRSSSPKAPESKPDNVEIKKEVGNEGESSSNVSSTNSGNTSAVLENEYEEFMKALTTSPKKTQMAAGDKVVVESSPSSGSIPIVASTPKVVKVKIVDTTIVESKSPVLPLSTPQVITILPKDIPLIPMPLPKEEIKPVPVPSPQIEIDAAKKPLLNLSLSASITLDIAPKFTTPSVASPLTSTNCTQAAMTHSPALQGIGKTLIDDFLNFTSPLTDTSVDSIKERTTEDEKTATNKPFVFTGMVLPSKRQLLNNSILNLDDSDDDERHAKPMKKLEDIMKENEIESVNSSVDTKVLKVEEKSYEREQQRDKEKDVESKKSERKDSLSKTSQDKDGKRRKSPERHSRMESPPRRSSYGNKRDPSPRRRCRESPGRRRGHSPRRHSPRRRPSPRRRSPAKRRLSPRRSLSPKNRRRASLSPRRRQSPRRSKSPKNRGSSPRKVKPKSPERHASSYKSPERHASSYKSPERHGSSYKSPEKHASSYKSPERHAPSNMPPMERPVPSSNNLKSPTAITSPMEGLKRSVADSTISDDLLLQRVTSEEYAQSPVTQFYEAHTKSLDSPRRESLDARINQVLGMAKEEPRPIPTTYSNYGYAQHFPQQFAPPPTSNVVSVQQSFGNFKAHHQQPKRNFVQVGNMVQILPTEDISMVQEEKILPRLPPPKAPPVHPSTVTRNVVKIEKSQIVQVGNMLQIVPTDMPSMPPLPSEPKTELAEPVPPVVVSPAPVQEKQSAESVMRLKVAERREEREKRRQERERRRKEKEKRRREKEKERQIKLKKRTENMIKRALELEAEGLEDEPESTLNETPAQWPPVNLTVISAAAKEVSKSILVRAGARTDSPVSQRRKVVQFADGIKPGEGTSPSGGEDLSSPPPRKKLDKAKRPKKPKSKQQKKSHKKKVKVKVIKKRLQTNESDEEDDLPPPSPPPGSPPPHVFPPRVKPPAQPPINNIQPYLTNVSNLIAVQPGHSQLQSGVKGHGQQQLFRAPQLNLIMHPPPHGPPHLLPHGPPPPPPHILHHGPPPPPGPPLFQHGPPPPPPHQHQGPPPPPPGALHLPPPHFHR